MLPIAPSQNVVAWSADTLFELAESIWNSLLEMDIQRTADRWTDLSAEDDVLTGCVHFDGDWRGAVMLVCPKTLARQAAAAMFKTAPSAITDIELRDVMGELTHMLGGNLKSLLPAPCHLSPPSVIEGYNIRMKGPVVEQVLLRCEGQPLQIIVFKREE